MVETFISANCDKGENRKKQWRVRDEYRYNNHTRMYIQNHFLLTS